MKLLKVCVIQTGMELWSCLNGVIYPLTKSLFYFLIRESNIDY